MPRLPDATAFGNRPTPQPQLGTVTIGDGDPNALMAGPNQTLKDAQGAYGMADLALAARKEFEAKAKVEQEKVDRMQAEDAYNKLQQRRIDLTVGDGGFTKVKGIDATKQPLLKDYGDKLGGYANEISQGLANDNQRALFNARATLTRMGLGEDILRHQMAETKVAEAQTYKATLDVERRKAIVNFQSPGDVEASMLRIDNAVRTYGQSNGWSPEMIEDARKIELGKINDGVVDQMIATGDLVGAQKWYLAHKEDVDVTTAKAIQAKTADAVQRQAYNGWQSTFLDIKNDNRMLDQWLKAVGKDPNLNEERRNVLTERGMRAIDTNKREASSAADRALRQTEMAMRSLETDLLQGRELSPDAEARILNEAKANPALQYRARELVSISRATREFRLADPMQQEQMITQATLGVRNGTVPHRLLTTMESIKGAQKRLMDEAPVTFAVQQGYVKPDDIAARPLDLTKPGAVDPNQWQARLQVAQQIAQYRGGVVKPFQPEEVAVARDAFNKMPEQQQSQWLGNLYLMTGRDKSVFRAAAAQLFKDDPAVASAAALAYGQVQDPSVPAEAVAAADTVLRGRKILFPDRGADGKPTKGTLVTMPDENKMRKDWDSKVGAAYGTVPEAGSTAFQVARMAYAGMVSRTDKSDYTVLDTDAWDKAIKIATGGVTNYRGQLTVLPRGMTDSDFRDAVQPRIRMLVASGAAGEGDTYSRLSDLPLMPAGEGKFYLRSGLRPLAGRDGKPLLIDLTKPLPPELQAKEKPADAYSEAMKNDVSFEGLVRGLAGRPLKDKQ